jgi:hypothetical protein
MLKKANQAKTKDGFGQMVQTIREPAANQGGRSFTHPSENAQKHCQSIFHKVQMQCFSHQKVGNSKYWNRQPRLEI